MEKGRQSLTRIDLKTKEIAYNSLFAQSKPVNPDRLQLRNNSFYILDKASGAILEFDKNSDFKRRFACADCTTGFIDFEVTAEKVWALEPHEPAVYRFDRKGFLEEKITLPDKVAFPCSLTIDPVGELLYILDRHASTIAVFTPQGEFKYHFLGSGQASGQLYFPTEIVFDPWGQLCVVEEGNGRVQVFSRR